MCISLIVVAIAVLAAGEGGASVTGVVRDGQSGEPVVGAVVALSDLDRSAITDSDGRYRLHAIPPGLQHVVVRRLGYAPRTLHAFVPPEGQLEIDVSLEPEPVLLRGLEVRPPLTVRGGEAESDSPPPPVVALSVASVRNHPQLAEPDVFRALLGGVVAADPEAPRGLHVRGGGADQVSFLLDGIPVLNPYHSVGLFSAWDPDVIARLRLDPDPFPAAPDALSGVVGAETRKPGRVVRTRGAASTSQMRFSADGPVPLSGGGFLLSGRRGFAGFPRPDDESSYVRGGSGDWLAKVEGRLAGGEIRLLGYGNRNRTATAASVALTSAPPNRFRWSSSSWGGEWSAVQGSRHLSIRAWHAAGDASARWAAAESVRLGLTSAREETGGVVVLEFGGEAAPTTVAVRASRIRASYALRPEAPDTAGTSDAFHTGTMVASVGVEHARAMSQRAGVNIGFRAALYGDRPRLAPRLGIRWTVREGLDLGARAVRTFQAEQSLANPESLVGAVFPAVLQVGAGTPGVPLARSDQAILFAILQAGAGVRIAAEAYVRDFDGLALVAPATGQPFAMEAPLPGTGTAVGGALELSIARSHYAVLGSYGFERARYSAGDAVYAPAVAPPHRVDGGILLRPGAATSLRLGISAAFGRRSTAVEGPFEWEACNALDRGCEFAGSPRGWAGELGGLGLPPYVRVDFGARRHWHLRLGETDAEVGAYATVSNILGRGNYLAFVVDPLTRAREPIEMQARAPLVAGLDWRF